MARLSGDQNGIRGPLGAGQRLRRRCLQEPQPQARTAFIGSDEDDLPAVGRERNRRRLVGDRRDDLGAYFWGRRLAQMLQRRDGERDDHHRGDGE